MKKFVVIGVLLIFISFMSGCTVTINGQEVGATGFSDVFGKTKLEKDTQKEEITLNEQREIEVICNSGDVTVRTTKADAVRAVLHKEIESTGTRPLIDDIFLDVREEDNKIILEVQYASGSSMKSETKEKDGIVVYQSMVFNGLKVRRMDLNLEVELPEQLQQIEVKSGSGEIDIDGLKNKSVLNVISSSGDKTLKNIQADTVNIEASSGNLDLQHLAAEEAAIISASGDKRLAAIETDILEIQAGSGNLKVDRLKARSAKVQSNSGDKILTDMTAGTVHIQSGSGTLTLNEAVADAIEITSGSGDIKVQKVKADVRFSASSANIDVGSYEGKVELETGSGDVWIKEGLFKKGSSFRTGSGDIHLSHAFEETPDGYRVHARSGDVRLYLPEDFKFDIDASTSSGRISCEFDNTEIKFNDDRSRDNEMEGKVNGGGTPFSVRTGSGRIHFKKR